MTQIDGEGNRHPPSTPTFSRFDIWVTFWVDLGRFCYPNVESGECGDVGERVGGAGAAVFVTILCRCLNTRYFFTSCEFYWQWSITMNTVPYSFDVANDNSLRSESRLMLVVTAESETDRGKDGRACLED